MGFVNVTATGTEEAREMAAAVVPAGLRATVDSVN